MVEQFFLPTVALLQGGYGPWGTLIGLLQGLVIAAGGVGFVVGLAVKSLAGPREGAQALGNRILEGSIAGLLIGLSAEPIYNLFVGWAP
jgi:hypothetical protein